MQDNFNTYSLIEDYLNGNLSNEERIAFESQLESNPELQKLVDDYSLVDVLIEENELVNINNKLTQIHQTSVKRKNILMGLSVLAILAISIAAYFMIPEEKIEISKEIPKSISYLVAEPTPFKIMDSMSEVELSTSIQQSKKNISSPELIDSIINEDKAEKIKLKEILPIIIKIKDSIIKPLATKSDSPIKVKSDSVVKITCEIILEEDNLIVTSSCLEKSTGSILFTKTNNNYLYSINSNNSFSSKPYFSSLREGNYLVSIKNKLNHCESEPVEIIIKGYKCNYIIYPQKFVFLEKSLNKFKDDNSVEVFIFNRNGNLVFNKIIATSEKFYWEGNSNTNLSTPMGNYTYLIKSGKKVSKGEITIIR